MKTYKNIDVENADKLTYSELLEAVKAQLETKYPDELGVEELTMVSDLMCRFDEDVNEKEGQYYTLSSEL